MLVPYNPSLSPLCWALFRSRGRSRTLLTLVVPDDLVRQHHSSDAESALSYLGADTGTKLAPHVYGVRPSPYPGLMGSR